MSLIRFIPMGYPHPIIRLITMISTLFILSACNSLCGNEIISEILSPNKVMKVVVFQRDCGATTGFSTQISILKQSDTLGHSTGNVLIADDNHGQAPTGPRGGSLVTVRWVTEKNLEITYGNRAKTFRQEKSYGPIAINYVHVN